MKKLAKITQVAVFACALALGLASCDTKNDGLSEIEKQQMMKDEAIRNIAGQFVNQTAVTTYTQLANSAEKLSMKLIDLKNNPTQDKVEEACKLYKETRKWWEMSEAFLFGPADYFGIDPFIDSWPLDEAQYMQMLAREDLDKMIADDKLYSKDVEESVLGFHAIEYTIFQNGKAKPLAAIQAVSSKALAYAAVVGMELRRRCFQLQISWGGPSLSADRVKVLKDAQLDYVIENSDKGYGALMLAPTPAQSTYKSWAVVAQSILEGCVNIVDEVGDTKIGTAHSKSEAGDENYIESPYSHNSLTDFADNIRGVQNAYMGGLDVDGVKTRDTSKSLHGYLSANHPEIDKKITDAIANAIAKIQAIPAPFKDHATDPSVKTAIEACHTLSAALNEAVEVF